MKSKMALLILVFFLAASGLAPAQEQAKIVGWEPMKLAGEPAYISLEVQFPCSLEHPQSVVTVNGAPAVSRGMSSFRSGQVCGQTYALYVGSPGKKKVKVALTSQGKTLTAATTLDFQSAGNIVLLNRVDGEAVLAPGEWRYWMYFVKDLQVLVNGAAEPFRLTKTAGSDDHKLLTFEPTLRAGRNTIEVKGKNAAGQEVSVTNQCYFLRDNKVKLGDTISFHYGYWGSKSGPFFKLAVEGKALKPLKEKVVRQAVLVEGAWLFFQERMLKDLEAVEPGEAILQVFEKKWFTENFQPKESCKLTVVK